MKIKEEAIEGVLNLVKNEIDKLIDSEMTEYEKLYSLAYFFMEILDNTSVFSEYLELYVVDKWGKERLNDGLFLEDRLFELLTTK